MRGKTALILALCVWTTLAGPAGQGGWSSKRSIRKNHGGASNMLGGQAVDQKTEVPADPQQEGEDAQEGGQAKRQATMQATNIGGNVWSTSPGACLPTGHAIWVYDLTYGNMQTGQPAMWAQYIRRYNELARESSKITTVYTYGGDMEYYPDDKNPYQTYFTPDNQKAAQLYSTIPGVKHVIAVIDGRMDGGEDWSPDLSRLTVQQVQLWADRVARLYCSFDYIDGLQVDLEPFNGRYTANLIVFFSRLSSQLRMADNSCVNANHPHGRSVSTFMYASAATQQVFAAMGSNGYIVVSGYDLGNGGPGVAQTPAQYRAALTTQLNTLVANAGSTGKYVIGIPAAASTNEFSSYVSAAGTTRQGYPNFSTTADSYVVRAVQTISQMVKSRPGYLGTALWGASSEMSYPPHSQNLFFPTHPFAIPGAMEWMGQNM